MIKWLSHFNIPQILQSPTTSLTQWKGAQAYDSSVMSWWAADITLKHWNWHVVSPGKYGSAKWCDRTNHRHRLCFFQEDLPDGHFVVPCSADSLVPPSLTEHGCSTFPVRRVKAMGPCTPYTSYSVPAGRIQIVPSKGAGKFREGQETD